MPTTRSPQVKRFESPKEKKERHASERAKAKAWSEERKKRATIASASTTKSSKKEKRTKRVGITASSYSANSSNNTEDYFTVVRCKDTEKNAPHSPVKTLFSVPKFQDRIADTERRVRECQHEVLESIESHEYHITVQKICLVFIDALAKNQFKSTFSFDPSQTEDFNRILSSYNEDYHNKILEDVNSILYSAGFQVTQIIPVNNVKPFRTIALSYDIHVTILSG